VANSPARLLTADELDALPPTVNLSGTRFVSRGLNVVFGASGAYKSFYALDAALQIAQELPVAYVAAEGAGGLSKRVKAWRSYHNSPPGNIRFFCEEVNLRDVAQVNKFGQLLNPLKPKLIVFDTLARCMVGGDENSAKDIGMVVHGCSILQRGFSTAVCLLHHSNRADRGERGSGALRGASDAMIEVVAGGDGVVQVLCSKTKDEEQWEPERLVFHQVDRSGVLISVVESAGIALKLTSAEKSIMEFIALSAFESANAQIAEVERALNISPRHVYRLLSGLKNKGITRDVNKGHPTVLTDMGREMLLTFTDKTLPVTEVLGKIEVE
jgi:hypothetical protein